MVSSVPMFSGCSFQNYSVTGDYSEDQRKQLEEERQVDQALAAAKVKDIAQGSGDFDPGDHIGGGRLLRKFRGACLCACVCVSVCVCALQKEREKRKR